MASTATWKQNDLEPDVLSEGLKNADGTAIALTGATAVYFVMRPVNSTTTSIRAAATVVTAALGVVRYDWVSGDTATVGVFNQEWEILWPSSRPQTVPNSGYNTIVIEDDLG